MALVGPSEFHAHLSTFEAFRGIVVHASRDVCNLPNEGSLPDIRLNGDRGPERGDEPVPSKQPRRRL